MRWFSSAMMPTKLLREALSCDMVSSCSISLARLMVAMGVLISCVMLLMNSVFIWSSLRWLARVRMEMRNMMAMMKMRKMLM